MIPLFTEPQPKKLRLRKHIFESQHQSPHPYIIELLKGVKYLEGMTLH